MEEIIILRYINIVLPIIGLIIWGVYYKRHKQPIAIAPIVWFINVIAYSIFRLYAGSDIQYYFITTTWSGVLRAYTAVLLIAAAIIFYPRKRK
jgi:hypothetical protein